MDTSTIRFLPLRIRSCFRKGGESRRIREIVVKFYLLGMSETIPTMPQLHDHINMSWTRTTTEKKKLMSTEESPEVLNPSKITTDK